MGSMNKTTELLFFMNLLFVLLTPLCSDGGAFTFWVTSSSSSCCADPVYGVSLDKTVASVDLALAYVNSKPDILPAGDLNYGSTFNSLKVLHFTLFLLFFLILEQLSV